MKLESFGKNTLPVGARFSRFSQEAFQTLFKVLKRRGGIFFINLKERLFFCAARNV